jgi:hypothetical protein
MNILINGREFEVDYVGVDELPTGNRIRIRGSFPVLQSIMNYVNPGYNLEVEWENNTYFINLKTVSIYTCHKLSEMYLIPMEV